MIESLTTSVYWVTCNRCRSSHQLEEVWIEEALAQDAAVDAGWLADGTDHYCPDCVPLMEITP